MGCGRQMKRKISQPISYSISVEDRDIVLRLNREAIDMDVLTRFLDNWKLDAIAPESKFMAWP